MQRSAARHEDKIFVHYEGNWNGSKTVYITNASQPLRNKRKSREGSYHTWKDNPNGMLEEESSTKLDLKIVAKYALKTWRKCSIWIRELILSTRRLHPFRLIYIYIYTRTNLADIPVCHQVNARHFLRFGVRWQAHSNDTLICTTCSVSPWTRERNGTVTVARISCWHATKNFNVI